MFGLPSGMPDLKLSSEASSAATFSGKVRTGNVPLDLTTGGGMRGGFVNNVAFPGASVIGADSGGTGATGGAGGLKTLIYVSAAGIIVFAAIILLRKK